MQIKNVKKIERNEPSGLNFYVDNREGVTRPSEGLSLRNFSGPLDQRFGSFFAILVVVFTPFCCCFLYVFRSPFQIFRVLLLRCLWRLIGVFFLCVKGRCFKVFWMQFLCVFLVVFGNGGEREEIMYLFACSCVLRLGLEVLEKGCLYRQGLGFGLFEKGMRSISVLERKEICLILVVIWFN